MSAPLERGRQHPLEAVDHDVADQLHLSGIDPFAPQVFRAGGLGDEQQVGKRVGDDAVNFLRHRAVEATQTGLDVYHRNQQLGSRQCACQRAGHVAKHHDRLRSPCHQHLFVALQDARGLRRASRIPLPDSNPARECRARERSCQT